MKEHDLLGKRLPRIDALSKATGAAKYTADLVLPRMLYGKILRSPHPHAKILNINTQKVERLAGVKAVITGKDTLGEKWGVFRYSRDQQFLPQDKVRYVGDEVAAVAAIDEEVAQEAIELIEVEYEVLPGVFNPEEAMKEGAPQIHDHAKNNINIYVPIEVGDLEQGVREADYIREDRFFSEEESYFSLEPYAVLANMDNSGNLEVWLPNASPHTKAKGLANLMGMALDDVKVRKVTIGGAFGGRSDMFPTEFIAALLSKKSKRPVKIVYTREENSIAIRQGHSMIAHIKTGVKKNGVVIARDMKCIMDGGAYSSTGPIATSVPFLVMEETYRMPNLRYLGYRVYTNKTPRGMIRTHGRAFLGGIEMQMDMIAKELQIDPVEMRLRNAVRSGDIFPTQSVLTSCGLSDTIKKAAERSGWEEKKGKMPPNRGIGMGCSGIMCGFPLGIRGGSSAMVKFNEEGKATVTSGVIENGQGNDSMVVQIVADELDLPIEDVRLISADTEITPIDQGAYSQATMFVTGNAVRLAAQDAKVQLKEIASDALEADASDLEIKKGKIYVKGSPDRGLLIRDTVRLGLLKGKPILGKGAFLPNVDQNREWVKNPKGQVSEAFSFGTTIAEVEVDRETGKVKVLNVTTGHDCGFSLNPMTIEGGIEGAVAMAGQGGVLSERHLWDKGHVLNPTFLEYKIPLAIDMPKIETVLVESLDPNGPYGAKEASMAIAQSAAAAYANAICDALGIWIHHFPFTPEKILKAIEESGKKL